MKILFLTKNTLAEQQLQTDLQLLGHEVFVSSNVLNHGLRTPASIPLIEHFDTLLLSENIANSEVKTLVSNLSNFDKMIIRISSTQVKEEIDSVHYVNTSHSVENLREKLATITVVPREAPEMEIPDMLIFSIKEQLLFDYVKRNEETVVSREVLCEYIWKEQLNNSRKSQLSSLVKKVNLKLKGFNDSQQIQTVWGKGYKYTAAAKEPVFVD